MRVKIKMKPFETLVMVPDNNKYIKKGFVKYINNIEERKQYIDKFWANPVSVEDFLNKVKLKGKCMMASKIEGKGVYVTIYTLEEYIKTQEDEG